MSSPRKKDTSPDTTSSRISAEWNLPFRSTVTRADRQNITFLQSSAEKERKALSSEVNRLKGALMVLEARVEDAERKEAYLRSLLSPIHRIPPEVMTEIFKACCHSLEGNSIPFSSSEPPAPVTLSMVCGFWRNIVLSTPSLWSKIHIIGYSSDPKSLNVTKSFMDRSQNAPLTLGILYSSDIPGRVRTRPDVIDTLVSHSNRWKSVELRIDSARSRNPSFASIHGQLSMLTSLTVDCLVRGSDYDRGFLHAFENAPQLRSVTLRDAPPMVDLILPWHQLEDVRLGYFETGRALQLLKNCTSVLRVTLDTLIGITSDADSDPSLSLNLPTVRTLSLITTAPWIMSSVFEYLSLPGLETLDIKNTSLQNWNVPWDVTNLLRALESCTLTSLTLTKVPLRDEDMISILETMPSLESLSFFESVPTSREAKDPENVTVTSHLLARLSLADMELPSVISPQNKARLIPRLKRLFLSVHARNLDQRTLVKAIISRCPRPDTSNVQGSAASSIDEEAGEGLRSFEIVVMVPGEKGTASLEPLLSLKCFGYVGLRVQVKPDTFKYLLNTVPSNMEDVDDAEQDSGMSDDSDDE